jgi:serpin B
VFVSRSLRWILAVAVLVSSCSASGSSAHSGTHIGARNGAAVHLVADLAPSAGSAGAAADVARAEQRFALDLINHVSPDGNVVISPSGLAIMLAMLQAGAGGTTRAEIAKVLHTSGLSASEQNAGWAALTDSFASAASSTVESANSLWLQRKLPMRAGFMAALARYFRSGIWQVDFAHDLPGALSAINSWVAAHTNGKITKLFDSGDLNPDTALVLANAVYFKAAWQYEFDPRLTREGTFHLGDGSTKRTPFMTYSGPAGFVANQRYEAAQFRYAGGRFAAQVVMPARGSLTDLIESLSPADFAAIANAPVGHQEGLRLPKFTVRSFTHLNEVLSQLGMSRAFGDGADFSAMSPEHLLVRTVVQRDYLRVDEHGTEAAAVTGGGLMPTAARAPVAFDHPFLFLVRDAKTGTILFAGRIENPAQSS